MAPEIPPEEDKSIQGEEDLRSIFTRVAAEKLPSWTKANEDKFSNFQQFMNHAVMRKVEETNQNIIDAINDSYLNTADENIVWNTFRSHVSHVNPKATDLFFTTTICAEVPKYGVQNCKDVHFRSSLDSDTLEDLKEDFSLNVKSSYFLYKGKELDITESAHEFAESFKSDNELVYYDRDTEYIHFLQPYSYDELELIDVDAGLIYELENELVTHHVWNVFDEEALMHNLKRLPRESNESIKERVNDKAEKPSDSTYSGLKRHIERALGVNVENYKQAKERGLDKEEVKIHDLSNDDYVNSLKKPNGMATGVLEDIAQRINDKVDIFWDDVIWDEGYWDVSERQDFRFIPFQTDI